MSQQPSALEAAVRKALIIARGDPDDADEQASITPFVESTSVKKADNSLAYRLFEAAASWLGSDPYLLSSAERGVSFSELERVKDELRAQQHAEDKRLGLLPEASGGWLPFAGVAR